LGDVAVLPQAEPFPGGIRWSLEFTGAEAARLLERAPALAPGRRRPSRAGAAHLLAELRVLLLRAGHSSARFSLSTIDDIEAGPTRVRLGGTCSPIVPSAFQPPVPAV
jgi:hypothetical protein